MTMHLYEYLKNRTWKKGLTNNLFSLKKITTSLEEKWQTKCCKNQLKRRKRKLNLIMINWLIRKQIEQYGSTFGLRVFPMVFWIMVSTSFIKTDILCRCMSPFDMALQQSECKQIDEDFATQQVLRPDSDEQVCKHF